jgi:hypothetical protein
VNKVFKKKRKQMADRVSIRNHPLYLELIEAIEENDRLSVIERTEGYYMGEPETNIAGTFIPAISKETHTILWYISKED